jgi:DNA-binding Xre family transcriptional regulator
MAIRWKLDAAMARKGWTAYRLAKETGLTASAIYKLQKKGDIRYIDVATLEKLASALGVKPFALLEITHPE